MTALGKGVGPPWAQPGGPASFPGAIPDRTRYSTSSAPIKGNDKPRNPNAGGGGHGKGTTGGGKGRGRGRGAAGTGGTMMEMVRVAMNTSTGTQDITFAGFGTPVAAIFFFANAVTDGTMRDNCQQSIGATDGTNQWVVVQARDQGVPTANTNRFGMNDKIAVNMNGSATISMEAQFDSWITDGVRIDITDAPGAAHLLTVILIGGAGVTAAVGIDTLADAGLAKTITPSLRTNILFACGMDGTMDDTAGGGYGTISWGFGTWDGSTLLQTGLHTYANDGGGTSVCEAIVRDTDILSMPITKLATLGNITATAFDITSGAGDDLTARDMGWLAINIPDGAKAWTGILDSPTATGEKTFSGIGFKPTSGILAMNFVQTVDTRIQTGDAGAWGHSVFTATDEFSVSYADEDAEGTMDTQSLSDDKAINLDEDDGTDGFEATFVEFTGDGVKLDFTVADGTARKWPALFVTL